MRERFPGEQVTIDRDGDEHFLFENLVAISASTPFPKRLISAVSAEFLGWSPSQEGVRYGEYLIELVDRLHI